MQVTVDKAIKEVEIAGHLTKGLGLKINHLSLFHMSIRIKYPLG